MGFVRRRAPFLLVAVVALVGATALVTTRDPGEDMTVPVPEEPPPTLVGDEAVTQFLDAWEQSRMGTYVVRSDFTRVRTTGQHFESSVISVQSPPDRLNIEGREVQGVLDGVAVVCSVDIDEHRTCREGAPEAHGTYSRAVAAQVDTLEGYVTGPEPLYRVTGDGEGCFRLEQDRHLPAAPYGTEARFCFDAETGAPTFTEIARPEGTDRIEAVDVRAEVTEADLQIPA